MVEESLKLANLDYKSHYFYHQNSHPESKFFIKSFDDYLHNVKAMNNYNLLDYNSLQKCIQINTLRCRHLLHDDFWVKITSKSNRLNMIEDLEEVNSIVNTDISTIAFVNSINSDDISNIEFLYFVNKLNTTKFNDYSIELKYVDFDEDTDNIKWIVIICKLCKDDNKEKDDN